jgi:uncharacterized membrane protein YgdD (TMEM256/DUF423 family)
MFAGTFAAHAIGSICNSPIQIRNWNAAVRSWLVHALVILVAGVLSLAPQAQAVRGTLAAAGVLFLVGTLLFSGCLAIFAISGRIIFAAIATLDMGMDAEFFFAGTIKIGYADELTSIQFCSIECNN